MLKKYITIMMVITTLLLVFSGCAGNAKSDGSSQNPTQVTPSVAPAISDEPVNEVAAEIKYPLVDEAYDFTIWTKSGMTSIADFNDLSGYQNIEKMTGIHINWLMAAVGQEREALNLIINSGSYPDLFQMDFKVPNGVDKNIDDGVIIPLNELLEANAPDYWALINANEVNRKDSMTDSGNIGAFCLAFFEPQPSWFGPVVRKDFLDAAGLDIPQTYDDWYEMLTAFKNQGVEAPLMLSATLVYPFSQAYVTGYDVNNSFFQIDGKVKYGPIEAGYKDYLVMLNKWYSDDLIDKDFYTKTGLLPDSSNILSDFTGVWNDIYTLLEMRKAQAENPNYDLVPVPLPTKKEGDALHLGFDGWKSVLGGGYLYVTTTCKDPAMAAKWANFFYTEDGILAANYGTEGESYTMVDGKPVFTELVTKNPDGKDLSTSMASYSTLPLQPKVYRWDRERVGLSDLCLSAPDIWASKQDGAYRLSNYELTTEESTQYSAIMGDIETYINEMCVKYVTGLESFDTYDSYVDQITSMGIYDAIQLVQTATDRYSKR